MTMKLIEKAADMLRAGGLVAFPTETVYGLGADASNEAAIRRIFAVKQRPPHHPLIVHIAKVEELHDWAIDIPPGTWALADAFWPGPLTLLLKKQAHVLDVLTARQNTIGLRIPSHPIAQALLQRVKKGIAGPSANKFTRISPTTAQAVHEEFGDEIDLILDGGDCQVGLESTIIDMTSTSPTIMRPGMINTESIANVLNQRIIPKCEQTQVIRAPGMHYLHYAPRTPATLLTCAEIQTYLSSLTIEAFPLAFIMHSDSFFPRHPLLKRMQLPNEPAQYAQALYRCLRALDSEQYKHILIEAVPPGLAWDAIRDRLLKATASR